MQYMMTQYFCLNEWKGEKIMTIHRILIIISVLCAIIFLIGVVYYISNDYQEYENTKSTTEEEVVLPCTEIESEVNIKDPANKSW